MEVIYRSGKVGQMSQDSFENVPNWFDRIEVRRVGRVKKKRNVVVEEPLFGAFCPMGRGTIL